MKQIETESKRRSINCEAERVAQKTSKKRKEREKKRTNLHNVVRMSHSRLEGNQQKLVAHKTEVGSGAS